ncbi:MAG: DUF411 domain-containing protein [Parvibaculum sp.]|uniref:DUF411 domain-containing protein n=1 Tax=Parvibaculum sp. TaxID=2024848 RepID=UPI003C762762
MFQKMKFARPRVARRLAVAVLLSAVAAMAMPVAALAAKSAPRMATLYKSPDCTCCDGYADHLRQSGFDVKIVVDENLVARAMALGVTEELLGCHTTLIDGYLVEGHVPIEYVHRLLHERPKIAGISVPGMPVGVPGMPGERQGPLRIFEIAAPGAVAGGPRIYAID